jgi:hypothetical protein
VAARTAVEDVSRGARALGAVDTEARIANEPTASRDARTGAIRWRKALRTLIDAAGAEAVIAAKATDTTRTVVETVSWWRSAGRIASTAVCDVVLSRNATELAAHNPGAPAAIAREGALCIDARGAGVLNGGRTDVAAAVAIRCVRGEVLANAGAAAGHITRAHVADVATGPAVVDVCRDRDD